MLQGTVKWYDPSKGWGYITRDDGGDVAVARGAILFQPPELATGQRVQFDIVDDRTGESALNVGEIGSTLPTRTVEKPPPAPFQGTVKWFDTDKGFGFITMDTGGDASVATPNIEMQPPELKTGQRVQFNTTFDRNGTWAVNVSGISSPAVQVGPASGLEGTVKLFDAVKGFGLITRVDGGGDVTVQPAAILAQPPVLIRGQRVRFDLSAQQSVINVSVIAAAPDQAHSTVNWMAVPLTGHGHGDHFYTTSSAERDSAASVNGYRSEGVACYVSDSSQAATSPLYRLFNSVSGDHFYTTSSAERDSAVSVHGYRSQGVACHVFDGQQAGTTPVYRLFNGQTSDHFYTTSAAERDSAVGLNGYHSEGIACYAFENQQAGSTALYRMFHP